MSELSGIASEVDHRISIQRIAVMRLEGGQHFDQNLEVFAQQGLAAAKAEFLDAMCDEQACHARDFFKA